MPKPYPQEFHDDVVRVAGNREGGVTLEQIAADFGVHPMTLSKWMRRADVDDGVRPGMTGAEQAETRELRKRLRLLEQEHEVLRRAAAAQQRPRPGAAEPRATSCASPSSPGSSVPTIGAVAKPPSAD